MFPLIQDINDVLPHIAGNENFSVNRKDDYTVIDYILNTPDCFVNSVQKECRGIIFDASTGVLLRRPLHKFFNFNERPESSVDNVDVRLPHVILEKLDGSMIVPFKNMARRIIWGSKAGETFLTPQVEKFVVDHQQYWWFANDYIEMGYTPIFEWCTRQNPIVIDYPEDRLVLTAIRSLFTGEYLPYEYMLAIAKTRNLDVVNDFGNSLDLQTLYEETKALKGIEGYVIRFNDGLMLKMKADDYVRQHRAKDDINMEKNVVAILVNNQADDFRSLLSDRDRARFEKFEGHFFSGLMEAAQDILRVYIYSKGKLTRKEFAIHSQEGVPPLFRSVVFNFWDKKDVTIQDIYYDIINKIKKSCGSQTSIDAVRILWMGYNWKDY